MKNILFVTNSNLLPSTNGAVIYSFGLIKYLKELKCNIILVNFYTEKPNCEQDLKELKKYCSEVIQVKLKRASYWENISLKYPITIKKYFKREMVNVLSKLSTENNFDVVFMIIYIWAYIMKLLKLKNIFLWSIMLRLIFGRVI